jgi:hypothetical protein
MYRKGKDIRKKIHLAAFAFVPSLFFGEKFPVAEFWMISAETSWLEVERMFNEVFHLPLYLPLCLHVTPVKNKNKQSNYQWLTVGCAHLFLSEYFFTKTESIVRCSFLCGWEQRFWCLLRKYPQDTEDAKAYLWKTWKAFWTGCCAFGLKFAKTLIWQKIRSHKFDMNIKKAEKFEKFDVDFKALEPNALNGSKTFLRNVTNFLLQYLVMAITSYLNYEQWEINFFYRTETTKNTAYWAGEPFGHPSAEGWNLCGERLEEFPHMKKVPVPKS